MVAWLGFWFFVLAFWLFQSKVDRVQKDSLAAIFVGAVVLFAALGAVIETAWRGGVPPVGP